MAAVDGYGFGSLRSSHFIRDFYHSKCQDTNFIAMEDAGITYILCS